MEIPSNGNMTTTKPIDPADDADEEKEGNTSTEAEAEAEDWM